MNSADVIKKLQALKLEYVTNKLGSDPSRLNEHLGEFLGYATLLYDFYATALKSYREAEAKVLREEASVRDEHNANVEKPSERLTVTEMEQRISVRLSKLKSQRDFLEVEVKGATLHINGCQSLLKNWGDEAKGIR